MSTAFLFVLLLMAGVGVMGIACLVALILVLVRNSSAVQG